MKQLLCWLWCHDVEWGFLPTTENEALFWLLMRYEDAGVCRRCGQRCFK